MDLAFTVGVYEHNEQKDFGALNHTDHLMLSILLSFLQHPDGKLKRKKAKVV